MLSEVLKCAAAAFFRAKSGQAPGINCNVMHSLASQKSIYQTITDLKFYKIISSNKHKERIANSACVGFHRQTSRVSEPKLSQYIPFISLANTTSSPLRGAIQPLFKRLPSPITNIVSVDLSMAPIKVNQVAES